MASPTQASALPYSLGARVADPALAARIHWTLRIASAACFIGHGAFGIITKSGWLPFFALAGIGPDAAYRLMPLVGSMDIALGLLLLWRPRRAILAWMSFWCVWTALLRPLTGLSSWEFFERAGNYGVPFAMLLLAGAASSSRGWLEAYRAPLDARRMAGVAWALRATTCTLLIGHGGLALSQKPLLASHLAWLGAADPASGLVALGCFEVALGLVVLLRPLRVLLLLALAWKLATELLFPLSGDYVWEFVERGGSYGAPLALFLVRTWQLREKGEET